MLPHSFKKMNMNLCLYTNSGKEVHKLIFIFLCAICFSILQTHKSLLRSPKQISQKNPESTLCIFLPELVLFVSIDLILTY